MGAYQAKCGNRLPVPAQFDRNPFPEQIRALVDTINYPLKIGRQTDSDCYQLITLRCNADGRMDMGYFPVLSHPSVPESIPSSFEIAEIINLQAVRTSQITLVKDE